MARVVISAGLATLALSLVGCGTIYNLNGQLGFLQPSDPDKAERIFGGVQLNAEWVTEEYARDFETDNPPPLPVAKFVSETWPVAFDVLLSLVGDMLTLPITIPATLQKPKQAVRGGSDTERDRAGSNQVGSELTKASARDQQ
jgi:hypothetical protein